MSPARLALIAGLGATGLLLQACASAPVIYGPMGPEVLYGYKDTKNQDGGFAIRVVLPPGSGPAGLREFFDRRAAELCPSGVARTNVYKVQRNEFTAMTYGSYVTVGSRGVTDTELEGYVYCKGETEVAKAEPAPAT